MKTTNCLGHYIYDFARVATNFDDEFFISRQFNISHLEDKDMQDLTQAFLEAMSEEAKEAMFEQIDIDIFPTRNYAERYQMAVQKGLKPTMIEFLSILQEAITDSCNTHYL